MKDLFRAILHRFSPRFFDVRDRAGPHHAVFEMTPQERLAKNARVCCKDAEDNIAVPALHKKFLNAVNKSGYWVPLLGWENTLFRSCVSFLLERGTHDFTSEALSSISTQVTHTSVSTAVSFMWLRYASGQAHLNNDIRQLKPVVKNRTTSMDEERTEMEIHMRRLLLTCPANVLTLKLIGTYYSPTFHCLLHPALSGYATARRNVVKLFHKMEENQW